MKLVSKKLKILSTHFYTLDVELDLLKWNLSKWKLENQYEFYSDKMPINTIKETERASENQKSTLHPNDCTETP